MSEDSEGCEHCPAGSQHVTAGKCLSKTDAGTLLHRLSLDGWVRRSWHGRVWPSINWWNLMVTTNSTYGNALDSEVDTALLERKISRIMFGHVWAMFPLPGYSGTLNPCKKEWHRWTWHPKKDAIGGLGLLRNVQYSQRTLQPQQHVEVSWNRGTPKSSIFMVFSNINHPFGVPQFHYTLIQLGILKRCPGRG